MFKANMVVSSTIVKRKECLVMLNVAKSKGTDVTDIESMQAQQSFFNYSYSHIDAMTCEDIPRDETPMQISSQTSLNYHHNETMKLNNHHRQKQHHRYRKPKCYYIIDTLLYNGKRTSVHRTYHDFVNLNESLINLGFVLPSFPKNKKKRQRSINANINTNNDASKEILSSLDFWFQGVLVFWKTQSILPVYHQSNLLPLVEAMSDSIFNFLALSNDVINGIEKIGSDKMTNHSQSQTGQLKHATSFHGASTAFKNTSLTFLSSPKVENEVIHGRQRFLSVSNIISSLENREISLTFDSINHVPSDSIDTESEFDDVDVEIQSIQRKSSENSYEANSKRTRFCLPRTLRSISSRSSLNGGLRNSNQIDSQNDERKFNPLFKRQSDLKTYSGYYTTAQYSPIDEDLISNLQSKAKLKRTRSFNDSKALLATIQHFGDDTDNHSDISSIASLPEALNDSIKATVSHRRRKYKNKSTKSAYASDIDDYDTDEDGDLKSEYTIENTDHDQSSMWDCEAIANIITVENVMACDNDSIPNGLVQYPSDESNISSNFMSSSFIPMGYCKFQPGTRSRVFNKQERNNKRCSFSKHTKKKKSYPILFTNSSSSLDFSDHGYSLSQSQLPSQNMTTASTLFASSTPEQLQQQSFQNNFLPVSVPPTPSARKSYENSWQVYTTDLLTRAQNRLTSVSIDHHLTSIFQTQIQLQNGTPVLANSPIISNS